MFGLFKSKPAPEGPVDIAMSMDIDAPAEEVYALIDFADPRNAMVARGEGLSKVGSDPDVYRLHIRAMPDHKFDQEILAAESPRHYAYRGTVEPAVGRLVWTEASFDVIKTGPASCRLENATRVQFTEPMTMKVFEHELTMMTTACHNTLAKLKIQAEYGVEAVNNAQMGGIQRIRLEG